MTESFLKRGLPREIEAAEPAAQTAAETVAETAARILGEIEAGGEQAALAHARKLDRWEGEIVVSDQAIEEACARVPTDLREAIDWAHDNIARFAEAQRATLTEMEVELRPGLLAGQRLLPIAAAGAYVPGGRYSHIASALMTVTTARVAGVPEISAVSPPRADAPAGVPDAILYTLRLCGATKVLAMGGIQGVAALAFGLFGLPKSDMIVGPGNDYVTEAKRQLYGRVGIDMLAGPTDVLILADASADPRLVAADLVGQCEHGPNTPVWLVTDSPALAEAVAREAPACIAALPEPNRSAAAAAWANLGQIIRVESRDAMVAEADRIAPEHLHVQAADLDWWKANLNAYGSLFLGPEATVAFGDKASGPNHVLPTSGAARYTGGLSVHKFLRTVTWQRIAPEALPKLAEVTARISRHEGMEAHARTADMRLPRD
jgi:sulfopropanediol 3-dehydrogenase